MIRTRGRSTEDKLCYSSKMFCISEKAFPQALQDLLLHRPVADLLHQSREIDSFHLFWPTMFMGLAIVFSFRSQLDVSSLQVEVVRNPYKPLSYDWTVPAVRHDDGWDGGPCPLLRRPKVEVVLSFA